MSQMSTTGNRVFSCLDSLEVSRLYLPQIVNKEYIQNIFIFSPQKCAVWCSHTSRHPVGLAQAIPSPIRLKNYILLLWVESCKQTSPLGQIMHSEANRSGQCMAWYKANCLITVSLVIPVWKSYSLHIQLPPP